MPRRKAGTLLPLEEEILRTGLEQGAAGFHGFGLAQAMRAGSGSRPLVAHGTLYKALGRLEEFGLLSSQWEDVPDGGRPRRRLYRLTAAGVAAARAGVLAPRPLPAAGRPRPRPA
jgi:PadR family transcriptional regulator PadR